MLKVTLNPTISHTTLITHLPIFPSTHASTQPTIYLSVHPSIHPQHLFRLKKPISFAMFIHLSDHMESVASQAIATRQKLVFKTTR